MNEEINVKNLLGVLGLCARAGSLICGTELICEALRAARRAKAPRLVLEAFDVSANTHKKLTDKCGFYKIRHSVIPVGGADLASALGHSGVLAAVAVTDENLCRAVEKQLDTER